MRMLRFRPRLTIRRLMIGVAIVGVLSDAGWWVSRMRARSATYQDRAYDWGSQTARMMGKGGTARDGGSVNLYDNENDYLRYAWRRSRADRYWRLALRPWMAVEPDPPPPEPVARPRPAIDCPAAIRNRGPWIRWYVEPVYPWWTFPWTWRNQRSSFYESRWSFP